MCTIFFVWHALGIGPADITLATPTLPVRRGSACPTRIAHLKHQQEDDFIDARYNVSGGGISDGAHSAVGKKPLILFWIL